jgi:DNA-binding SARP family transcriptional activator/Tfp pilus assembly protein PilF/TolB-like protein
MPRKVANSPDHQIRLRTFGDVGIRHPAQGELKEVLRSPKRLALLVYLALSAPRGFVRRDTLLALFWPESDTERARGSLRSTLHFLRKALGEGVVATRGTEEVGLVAEAVWCDAAAFEEALDAGRFEEALELYRGDLLAGFNLSGCPEWERWLDAERARLRGRAQTAAWELAEIAETAGKAAAAAECARRAAAFAPDEEEPHRRLLLTLERLGDRASALRAYEEFSRRLAREYEVEPSRKTQIVAEAIRFKQERGEPQEGPSTDRDDTVPTPLSHAPPVPSLAADPPADLVGPPIVAPERSSFPAPSWTPLVWRRRAVLSALLAVLVGVGWWRATRRAGHTAADTIVRVAVLPFTVRGTSEWAYLSEGMAEILSTKLDGAGSLRTVDPRVLLGSLKLQGGVVDPERARRFAERFTADQFVLGSVVSQGTRLQLSAALYDGRKARRGPLAEAVVEGRPEELPGLVDALAVRLLAGRLRGPGARLDRTAVLTTPSLSALKSFLRGQRELRAGHSREAVDAFRQALAEDSAYGLAWYRLSVAQQLAGGEAWRNTAAEALRRADRLPAHDRLLLNGWTAYGRLRFPEAERWFREAVQSRPDDVEAWEQLSEMLFHGGPQRGVPVTDSRAAWERVLELEPENVSALLHLARIASRERRREELDHLTRRALELNPDGDRTMELLGLRGVALGDQSAMQRAVAELRAASDERVWIVGVRVLENTGDPQGVRPLVGMLTDALRSPRARAMGHVLLAQVELARGRWSGAHPELRAAWALDPAMALEARVELAALPFLPVPREEVESVRGILLRHTAGIPSVPALPSTSAQQYERRFPELRSYALGLISARQGEAGQTLRHAEELERSAATPGLVMPPAALAAGIRAHASWAGARGAGGLAVLDHAWRRDEPISEVTPYLLSPAHPRFLRAELLRSAGRDREALGWYASVVEDLDLDVIYHAPSHLRRAEILDRLGRREEAAKHYRRFVELWKDADPELQPLVARARKRLEEIA